LSFHNYAASILVGALHDSTCNLGQEKEDDLFVSGNLVLLAPSLYNTTRPGRTKAI
jgi:hypothetical protein